MADGVDHIDIYADVEEEFSQVMKRFTIMSTECALFQFVCDLFVHNKDE